MKPDHEYIAREVDDLALDPLSGVGDEAENITAGAIRAYEAVYGYRKAMLKIVEGLEQDRADMQGFHYNNASRIKRTIEDALDCLEAYHECFLERQVERAQGGALWAQMRDWDQHRVDYRDWTEPREITHPQPTRNFPGGAN